MNNIIFAGLAKNCRENLKKNIEFIERFNAQFPRLNIFILILESDSIDGTKEYLKKLNSKKIDVSSVDNLDKKYIYRTEKISHCRNILLEKIKQNYMSKELLYIPLDLDIDIFKYIDEDNFFNLIKKFEENDDVNVLFPYGYPYYYDIHALRAPGWNMKSPWEVVKSVNKYLVIGKIISRYLFVYKKQKKYKAQKKLINVESAFGGIGIYKVYNNELEYATYSIDINLGNNSCEHTAFNSYFTNKFIDCSWKLPSPKEHIIFKELNFFNKIVFITNSIISDFKNLK